MQIAWLTAFLDFPGSTYQAGVDFWSAATGQVVSATRGEHDEFATLLPIGGDDYLRVQRLQDGPARMHLDLHTGEPEALGRRAEALDAELVHFKDYATYVSPGGLVFCVITQPCSRRTAPARWRDHTSLVDQVCVETPPTAFVAEVDFWSGLFDVEAWRSTDEDNVFAYLPRAHGHPLRMLLKPRSDLGEVTAHVDFATDDQAAEVQRLVALDAEVVEENARWTTMRAPGGHDFCVTDRDPSTGSLPGRR